MTTLKDRIHRLPQPIAPTILTIFGSTGDLASDYLLPALAHLVCHGLVPKDFFLVCVGRRDLTPQTYLNFVQKKSGRLKLSKPDRRKLLRHLAYFRADLDDAESFAGFAPFLKKLEGDRCMNRLFYLATAPAYFAVVGNILKRFGLLVSCDDPKRSLRVLIEKPFGSSFASARALNRELLQTFDERQIYRIDHYQGKETVQNLMVVRFANSLFEPLWNRDYVSHIEVSALEADDARDRAAFYDQTGALKDFLQNHLLQILALVAMDEPYDLTADHIRGEKLKILQHLVPFTAKGAEQDLVRGQYDGYQKHVGNRSQTETYLALKTFIDTPRWRGVPMYLRTGKALGKKLAEVSVHFKELPRCIFRGCAGNVLTFRLQPDESVHLQLNNKVPGFGIDLHQGDYEFGYQKAFMSELPSAYERLLLDFMQGDQRLFIRSDEIEAAWKFVDSVASSWSGMPLHRYRPGSSGPKAADDLVAGDGRTWWTT